MNRKRVVFLVNASVLSFCLALLVAAGSFAQGKKTNDASTGSNDQEQTLRELSKQKWQWMADKNVDKLTTLFDDKSKFVHMSGTWKKDEELDIIKTGSIWYKQADVHDVAVEQFDDTAIIWIGPPMRPHYAGGSGPGQ